MRLTKEQTLKHLLEDEQVFVLYSAIADPKKDIKSKDPLIFIDPMLHEAPITRNVQVWVYDTNENCVEAVKKFLQNKVLCMSVRFAKDTYRALYLNMAECGAESIVYHCGEDVGEVAMNDPAIVELLALKEVNQAQRDLTRDAVLYWQQLHQNMAAGDKVTPQAKELEALRSTGMTASMINGGIILPVSPNPKNPKEYAVPIFQEKDKDGKVKENQLLGFTNVMELSRHFGSKLPSFRLFPVKFIASVLADKADCLVINKSTTLLRVNKNMINRVVDAQNMMNAVESGEKEPTQESVMAHLRYDRNYFVLYTAILLSNAGEQPKVQGKNPYINEDQESFNDQVWIFADQEDAKVFASNVLKEKRLLLAVREMRNRDFATFYTTLASKAVNSIVYSRKGKTFEIDMDQLVKLPDFSSIDEKMRPIVNPTLQLSAQYYWQEMFRAIKMEERSEEDKEALQERNREFLANLLKSEVYIRFVQQERDGQKVTAFPMDVQRDAEGKVVAAEFKVFTDLFELQKYFGANIPNVAKIKFEKLGGLMNNECTGIVLDPAGVDLKYSVDKVKLILGIKD